jgi:galactokinase
VSLSTAEWTGRAPGRVNLTGEHVCQTADGTFVKSEEAQA